jgi:hypothetical protein
MFPADPTFHRRIPMKPTLLAAILAASLSGIAVTTALAADAPAAAKSQPAKDEGVEVKIKFAECPKAVQDTLTKESGGAAITTVDKETEDGKTTYEADAVINGKNYELKVAEDGTLISKKLDLEEDEKDENAGAQTETPKK